MFALKKINFGKLPPRLLPFLILYDIILESDYKYIIEELLDEKGYAFLAWIMCVLNLIACGDKGNNERVAQSTENISSEDSVIMTDSAKFQIGMTLLPFQWELLIQ